MKTKISKPSVYGNEKYNIAVSELKQRLSLIITALIGTAFGFICLGAYIVKSSQSQIIPYLVTVDTHGVILAKGRIDLNNIYVVLVERDGCTYDDLLQFDKLPFKHKVALVHKEYPEIHCSYVIRCPQEKGLLGQIINYQGFLEKDITINLIGLTFWI